MISQRMRARHLNSCWEFLMHTQGHNMPTQLKKPKPRDPNQVSLSPNHYISCVLLHGTKHITQQKEEVLLEMKQYGLTLKALMNKPWELYVISSLVTHNLYPSR